MKKIIILGSAITCLFTSSYANISVVAAENQYGSVAKLIGGEKVDVTSIISNADGDPHTFISSVNNAKLLDSAQVIIYNGADYDNWVNSIVKNNTKAVSISAQSLIKPQSDSDLGVNPHLWYEPSTFDKMAQKLEATFTTLDPENKKYYQDNLDTFEKNYAEVYKMVDNIKESYNGTPVTATEPLFGYMSTALGLDMKGIHFQWVIMNDSEPTPKMMIKYQDLLSQKKVDVLFYNEQVVSNITKNILNLAKKNDIQVVGLTETMPQDKNAITWMISTLTNTKQALEKAKSFQS